MRALTSLGLDSLNIPSGHPRKKLSKSLDIKILLTHLSFLACGSLGVHSPGPRVSHVSTANQPGLAEARHQEMPVE